MNRTILAGILGGIAMFVWTSIAHMALPLGEAGVSELSDESNLLDHMKESLQSRNGLFLFPGMHAPENATKEQKKDATKQMMERLKTGPSGLLVFHPTREFALGRWLTIEFLTELLESILVIALLVQTRLTSFGGRVAFVTVAGILAAITTNLSYWNWYGFPPRYTAGYMSIEIIGFFVIGLVAALVLPKRSAA
jgi:hypothetical protein